MPGSRQFPDAEDLTERKREAFLPVSTIAVISFFA